MAAGIRTLLRILPAAALAALALSGCGPDREEDLARELAEAKAAAARAEAGRIAAEEAAAAARRTSQNENYAAFYGDEDTTGEEEGGASEPPESAEPDTAGEDFGEGGSSDPDLAAA